MPLECCRTKAPPVSDPSRRRRSTFVFVERGALGLRDALDRAKIGDVTVMMAPESCYAVSSVVRRLDSVPRLSDATIVVARSTSLAAEIASATRRADLARVLLQRVTTAAGSLTLLVAEPCQRSLKFQLLGLVEVLISQVGRANIFLSFVPEAQNEPVDAQRLVG